MNDSKKLLKSILGDQGYQTLEKAIYKQRTSAVIDPLEFYLPLIVVPRAIISWLVQNVQPMKTGDIKDIDFPGRDDIKIHVEKQDIDQYRAEFRSGGKIIHSFEKQSLPAASAHLMTVGEMYESFAEPKKEDIVDTPKAEAPAADMVRQMMSLSNVSSPKDAEAIKWEMSHANVRELTTVIGKLIDTLTVKQMSHTRLEAELDKVSEKEVPDKQGNLEATTSPEEKAAKDAKAASKDAGMSIVQIDKDKARDDINDKPDIKTVQSGEQAQEAKIQKEALNPNKTNAPSLQAAKNISSPRMAGAQKERQASIDPRIKPMSVKKDAMPTSDDKPMISSETVSRPVEQAAPETNIHPASAANMYFKKKAELLMKPISKEEMGKAEMPKGAGQPRPPAGPKPPKPPVPASNQPKQSAAKQAQSSARGGYTPPKTPGAAAPKNPTAKPKAPAQPKSPAAPKMAKGEYFKKMLDKSSVKKSISTTATEEQLFKACCRDCGVPEFIKGPDGHPKFKPCACFMVLKKDQEGKPYKFVTVLKKNDGHYGLSFAKDADPDTVKIFLLTLKAQLLLKKKHGL